MNRVKKIRDPEDRRNYIYIKNGEAISSRCIKEVLGCSSTTASKRRAKWLTTDEDLDDLFRPLKGPTKRLYTPGADTDEQREKLKRIPGPTEYEKKLWGI